MSQVRIEERPAGGGWRDAAVERVRSVDRVTWVVLGITVVALLTRVVGLGVRALHHDESLHLTYAWYFAEGRGYEHNPLMHGPLQFHLIAGFFKVLGDSEFVGRLPHALAGTALVATPLLFRRHLSTWAVVLASAFLLVSPVILYYSRFARNEPFVGLFTVLMLLAVLRYRDREGGGQFRWLVLFSACLALQFAAKETAYIVAALFLLYLNFTTAHELFWQPRRARGEQPPPWQQALHGLWLIPSAWAIAVAWPALGRLRERFGWGERPREADLLVVTGTLVLPLLAAFVPHVPEPLRGWGGTVLGPPLHGLVDAVTGLFGATVTEEERTAAAIVLVLLLATGAVGWWWGRLEWAICFAVFTVILVPLYSAWGTHLEGVAGIYWTSLDYWLDQQEVNRGNQPWFYYLMMMPLYESLVLIPGLLGGLWYTLRRRDPVAALFLWWFLGTFAALSYAGEKMPWLNFHLALPLCFLAAHTLGHLLPRALEAARRGRGTALQWAGGAVGLLLVAMLGVLAVRTDVGLNRGHPDTPVEPLIYVQTSPDVPPLADAILETVRQGHATRVVIETGQSLTWPWAWYVRELPVLYVSAGDLDRETLNPDDIVITNAHAMPNGASVRSDYESPVPFVHRWWFPEAGYRSITWGGLRQGVLNLSLVDAWAEFVIHRGQESDIGALRGEVFVPEGVSTLSGVLGR